MMSYSDGVKELFESQLADWDLANANYKQLDNVKTRSLIFEDFQVLVQYNPGRITSSAAKVDTKSIEARPCFLCGKNRPAQQRGLAFGSDLTILVNPFPIFRKHLTIVANNHTDQRIGGNMMAMLDLARELPDYQIFYNGPQCGASAPDHFHFQAGNKGFLPIENDFLSETLCKLSVAKDDAELWQWAGYQRGLFSLKSASAERLAEVFDKFCCRFAALQTDRPEPMLNILASYDKGEWIVHLFPRKLHRPTQYFADDDSRILLSPASVDMGGVIITPREKDFLKINKDDLTDIFSQVSLSNNELLPLLMDLL